MYRQLGVEGLCDSSGGKMLPLDGKWAVVVGDSGYTYR